MLSDNSSQNDAKHYQNKVTGQHLCVFAFGADLSVCEYKFLAPK